MKSDFSNIDEQIAASEAAASNPTTTALATAPTQALSADFDCGNDGFDGEVDEKLVSTPYIELAHGVGGLAEKGFNPGTLVYNKEVALAEPKKGEMAVGDGVNITILGGFIEYVEDVSNEEWNNGIRPRRSRKEQELRNLGLVTNKERRDSNDAEARIYRPAMQLKVLVEGKGGEGFPLDCPANGKSYALAGLNLTKGSYWGAGKVIGTFINECRMIKRPLNWKTFRLYTKLEKFPGSTNAVWSIKAAPNAKNDEAFLNWVKELGV